MRQEAFRREIHEGLNVVENWNGANGFVFFGKAARSPPTASMSRKSPFWRYTSCKRRWCM
nr:Tn3 family transposase [Sphingobium sp. Z007]